MPHRTHSRRVAEEQGKTALFHNFKEQAFMLHFQGLELKHRFFKHLTITTNIAMTKYRKKR